MDKRKIYRSYCLMILMVFVVLLGLVVYGMILSISNVDGYMLGNENKIKNHLLGTELMFGAFVGVVVLVILFIFTVLPFINSNEVKKDEKECMYNP